MVRNGAVGTFAGRARLVGRWPGRLSLALPAAAVVLAMVFIVGGRPAADPRSEPVAAFAIDGAKQAVAVDASALYAVDNRTVSKYDKRTRRLLARWTSPEDGSIQHLNSATVVDGRIYLAHSNYPAWPMASSIEIFDAAKLIPVESHSLGIQLGSLTWLDRGPDGSWYGGFANYDHIHGRGWFERGDNLATQIVRFDAEWRPVEQWTLPNDLVTKFGGMSNSGGSFGPDGKLWITGHDAAEAYRLEWPTMGTTMRWTGTLPLPITGQGIAWDRSRPGTLYGVSRGEGSKGNQVVVACAILDGNLRTAPQATRDCP